MRSLRKSAVSWSIALLACYSGTASAEGDDAAAEAARKAAANSGVRIELVAQPREAELPSRFHLAMRVVNPTDQPVILRNFTLTPLEEPGGLQIADGCNNQKKQFSIDKRSSYTITCQFYSRYFDDSILMFPASLFGSWSLLTLQPGDYRFVANAEIRLNEQAVMVISETVPVRIRPTVWQVCAGASVGALLLVVFTFSSARAREVFLTKERVRDFTASRLWAEAAILWLGATVAASIFILLTYRLKDVSSPITITVNDFYGGMVFGLFGVFIADMLAGRLYAAAAAPSPAASTTTVVPPAATAKAAASPNAAIPHVATGTLPPPTGSG